MLNLIDLNDKIQTTRISIQTLELMQHINQLLISNCVLLNNDNINGIIFDDTLIKINNNHIHINTDVNTQVYINKFWNTFTFFVLFFFLKPKFFAQNRNFFFLNTSFFFFTCVCVLPIFFQKFAKNGFKV